MRDGATGRSGGPRGWARSILGGRSGDCGLLCSLIDPSADKANLLFGQRIPFAFRRHGVVFHQSRHTVNERALRAILGNHIRAILAAFQSCRQRVETQFALLLFGTMAFEAGFFKDGLDVLREGHSFFLGGGWNLAEVGASAQKRGPKRESEDGEAETEYAGGEEGSFVRVHSEFSAKR